MFGEPNIEIYRFASVNITFLIPINLDIGLIKHQLLFYYFSVSSGWLIMSKNAIFSSVRLQISLFSNVLITSIILFLGKVKSIQISETEENRTPNNYMEGSGSATIK